MTATIRDITTARPEWLHPTRRALLLSFLDGSIGELLLSPLGASRNACAMFAPWSTFDGFAVSYSKPTEDTSGRDLAANLSWLRAAAEADDLGIVWGRGLMRVTHDEAHGWRFTSEAPAAVWSLPLAQQ